MTDPGCFWHGTEPIPERAYKVCGECWHCWPTRADFDADVRNLARELDSDVDRGGGDLPFCPLCSHDF